MTGAMACSAVPRSVASVCQLYLSHILADPISLQAAGQPGVHAWSIPKLSNASNICRTKALLSPVGAKDLMPTAVFMVAWLSPAMLGSCRYVGLAAGREVDSLNEVLRLETVRISAHATTFVVALGETALRLGVAILVRSRKSAAKLSWRRGVLEDILNPSECLSYFDSEYPLVWIHFRM